MKKMQISFASLEIIEKQRRGRVSLSGFTPLQMNSSSNIDYKAVSDRIVKKKSSISVTGFTLLELMVATGILLIVISGLLVTIISCILMNESNNNLVTAVNDAQYVLEQIKGLAYNDIDTYTPPALANLNNETIPNPTIVETGGIKEVTVNVNWTERQRNRTFSLSTRIAR